MHIAIISGINPIEFKDYLDSPEQVVKTNSNASSVHAIIHGLLKLGHRVTIVSSTSGPEDKILYYSGTQLRIYLVQYHHGLMGLNVIPKMRKYLREHLNEFDVLHAQWTYSFAYTILPFVGKKPCFCSVRDWCPYLMTLPISWSRKLNMWVNYFLFRKVMASKKMVKVANSKYTADKIAEWYKTDESQIIIPNPIKEQIILDERREKNERPIFISISSLLKDPRKNVGTLLLAFSRLRKELPDASLLLVGMGTQQDFEKISDQKDFFDRVTFCGRKSHMETLALMDQSTILVHPALEETFGNIFLEAAARCIPVIGGEASGAVPYVLEQGQAGYLCDVTSVDSLYNAMKFMVEHPEHADQLARKSMLNIRQKYSEQAVARQHIELYERMLNPA